MSIIRFVVLVTLGLLALVEVELWRRRPLITADSSGGVYLARAFGRSYYCLQGDCQPVGRARR